MSFKNAVTIVDSVVLLCKKNQFRIRVCSAFLNKKKNRCKKRKNKKVNNTICNNFRQPCVCVYNFFSVHPFIPRCCCCYSLLCFVVVSLIFALHFVVCVFLLNSRSFQHFSLCVRAFSFALLPFPSRILFPLHFNVHFYCIYSYSMIFFFFCYSPSFGSFSYRLVSVFVLMNIVVVIHFLQLFLSLSLSRALLSTMPNL